MEHWHPWLVAFSLMLVLEGLMPALAPGRWRQTLLLLAQTDERHLRLLGIGSLLTGAGLLWLLNG